MPATVLTEATQKRASAYSRRIRALVRTSDKWELSVLQRAQTAMRQIHLELEHELLDAPWAIAQRQTIQAELTRTMTALANGFEQTMGKAFAGALEANAAANAEWLTYMGFPLPAGSQLFGVSNELAIAASNVAAEQLVAVSNGIVNSVTREVSRVALGGGNPQEAIRRLMQLQGQGGYNPIGPFRTMRQRVEADVRTELHRMYNVADEIHHAELDRHVPGVRYVWAQFSSGDRRRESHARVAAESQANPLKPGQKFTVNGHKALHPHDPNLPASEVVNCSCKKFPTFDHVDPKQVAVNAMRATGEGAGVEAMPKVKARARKPVAPRTAVPGQTVRPFDPTKLQIRDKNPVHVAQDIVDELNRLGYQVTAREAVTTNSIYISGERISQIRVSDHSRAFGTRYRGPHDIIIRSSHTTRDVLKRARSVVEDAVKRLERQIEAGAVLPTDSPEEAARKWQALDERLRSALTRRK